MIGLASTTVYANHYAIFDEFCEKNTDEKKSAAYFICKAEIFQMKLDVDSNSETILSLNNTVNQLTVRINELTALSYPDPVKVLVPPVPELVPLPKQPVNDKSQKLTPDAPVVYRINVNKGSTGVYAELHWQQYRLSELPRGASEPKFIVSHSTDAINWDSKTFRVGTIHASTWNLPKYDETFFKVAAVNNYGTTYSVIHSAIPMDFGDRETGRVANFYKNAKNISMYVKPADWLFGEKITNVELQRSVNYGSFESIINKTNGFHYKDSEVVENNIYSYRTITTTTGEVHPRSGFISMLYTLN